jgi:N-acetylmuramoyl-L-alanine amidase
MRKIDEIIVHCTATQADWWKGKSTAAKVAEVKKWHTKGNGWSDIGYHYLIDRDGTVVQGRSVETVGAHTKGHNATTIAISLFGGHGSASTDSFSQHFTQEQDKALRELIEKLKGEHKITKVSGHNQYAAKACPGFSVPKWYEKKPSEHKLERTSPAQSTTVQASAVQIASGAGAGIAAVGSLSGTAQVVALIFVAVVVLAGMWIMRERLKAWAEGRR